MNLIKKILVVCVVLLSFAGSVFAKQITIKEYPLYFASKQEKQTQVLNALTEARDAEEKYKLTALWNLVTVSAIHYKAQGQFVLSNKDFGMMEFAAGEIFRILKTEGILKNAKVPTYKIDRSIPCFEEAFVIYYAGPGRLLPTNSSGRVLSAKAYRGLFLMKGGVKGMGDAPTKAWVKNNPVVVKEMLSYFEKAERLEHTVVYPDVAKTAATLYELTGKNARAAEVRQVISTTKSK